MISIKEKGSSNVSSKGVLPLLIKKYDDGEFTADFLRSDFDGKISISKPRGRGMSLQDTNPGKIVMFAGGTGLYPFSDLIDLLYKQNLVNSGHAESGNIKAHDPLLGDKLLDQFQYTLYIAVNEWDELHPITLFQCNELAKAGKMKCYARVKKSLKNSDFNFSHIESVENYFEERVRSEAKD